VYEDSEVVTFDGSSCHRATFAETAARAGRLANALEALGVQGDDRVGTFAWNTQEHLDAYLAVPAMGAVLHTLNVRLHPEQLAYVVNRAGDKVIIVNDTLVPVLAEAAPLFETVQHYVVVGRGDASGLGRVVRYDELLAASASERRWAEVDERDAAILCFTTGTTGDPKGVAYSHRSIYLHTLQLCSANLYGFTEHDRLLVTVPMFHSNAMGVPFAGWMVGADLVLPGRHLQAEPLTRLIGAERPTWAGAVPVIWNEILQLSRAQQVDLSSLRLLACGGAPVPRDFIETFRDELGLQVVQGWGMTETSPVAAVNTGAPKHADEAEQENWMSRSGRLVPGVEARVVGAEGEELPWDGRSAGEIQVRGPWVAGSYFGQEGSDRFQEGWLRTGDIGVMHRKGYVQITDRLKDVIKSGGEWISSVELETGLLSHPAVLDAAVVGLSDPRWQERPLACVVTDGGPAVLAELRAHLAGRVARFWIPEYWSVLTELPRTGVGKLDKARLRALVAGGAVEVLRIEGDAQ
jgi:fatty-acyl-CoA synthase